MKIGCHAVLFGAKLAEVPAEVFAQLNQSGFQGAEVGIRFMKEPGAFEKVISAAEKEGIEISAIHHMVRLTDFIDDPQKAAETINDGVALAKRLVNKNIELTGVVFDSPENRQVDERLSDPEFVKKVMEGLNASAKSAAAEGVSINYHNHSWEFENDALIFNSMIKYAPELMMGMDTGWAYRSGYDPIKLIRENPSRYRYLHIRDYNSELGEFVNVGEGEMNLKELFKAAEEALGADGWAIVEYETGPKNYKRYVTAKIYLDWLLG